MTQGRILTQSRITQMTERGLWQNRTAADYLSANLAARPDRVFITDHNSMTGRSTSLSYRHLDRLSRRIAAGLIALGVARGDVVSLQLPNWWEIPAIHLACVRIGAITNPLMPIFREHELRFMLAFAATKVLFIPRTFRGFDYAPMIESLRPDLPALEHVFVVGGEGDNAFEERLLRPAWEERMDTAALLGQRALKPNEIAEYCYTSGTSGQPKCVMHTYNTLVACLGAGLALELDRSIVVLMGSPLAHQTGFLFGFLLPLVLGGRTVLMDIWQADEAVRLIDQEQITFTMGATPFLSDLSESPLLERYPTASLEFFICGGAPIPRVLVQTAKQRLGANIVAGWGMSENGLVTATLRGDPQEKVCGTDGICWHGMETRIVDENGNEAAPDTPGDLQVRGAANFVGYLKRPDAYEVDAHGWFNTGDIASRDVDGYIRLVGRAKDIIIRGGENVPVVEVEDLIYEHPAVREIAIVAMPDPRLGERGCAFLSLKPGASLSFGELQTYLAQVKVAKNYWPERLETMPELPRTPSGKIQKFKLRAIAARFTP
ncbi:MAG: AMP-binding protein [Gammaproteobacteria bacterium]|nr:AMP-binding protein [Gammaproteobacteria bacterium]